MLVFVVGAFAEMSEDVSRICDITAHDLARTHISYYNDDSKRTKGIELELIQSHMAQKPVLRGEVGCACVAH